MTLPTLLATGSALMWSIASAHSITPSVTAIALRALDPNNNASSQSSGGCLIGGPPPCGWTSLLATSVIVIGTLVVGILQARYDHQLEERNAQINLNTALASSA